MCLMTDVRRLPVVTRSDVRALVAEVGPGVIPFSDIYGVYVGMMAVQGRSPVVRTQLGLALKNAHQRSLIRRVDGKNVRCSVIRPEYLEWLDHDKTPE